jgi:hypothetical protein
VYNFNPKSRNSLELYETVKYISEEISNDLKIKTTDYLCENSKYYMSPEYVEDTTDRSDEHFSLQIKYGNEIFIERLIPSQYYHPKVRTVDIRPKLKMFLTELTDVMSSKKLKTTYLNYQLAN